MRQSIRLGRVAGVPVGMHWSVIVIFALITDILAASVLPSVIPHVATGLYWTVAAAGAVLFVAALGAHEIAHAVVARRLGVEVRSVTLWMLGGVAELAGDPPTASADLKIAIAGPATSFAASILFGGAAVAARSGHGPAVITAALGWLALMNMLLAVFNLLPGAPLDGGRILRGLLWKRYGDRQRASRAAERSGQVLGILLGLAGFAELFAWRDIGGLWLMLIGWFLVTMARSEQQAEQIHSSLAGLRVRDIMLTHPEVGGTWTDVAGFTSRVVLASRQTVFPVVGFDGELAGVVFTDTLARVPPASRSATRLGQIAIPVPSAYLADPDAPADSLVKRPPLRGQLLAVVLLEGRLTGLVTAEELRLAMTRAGLASGTPAMARR
jgi:Zn-dependent protease/CBS domain-containing protein